MASGMLGGICQHLGHLKDGAILHGITLREEVPGLVLLVLVVLVVVVGLTLRIIITLVVHPGQTNNKGVQQWLFQGLTY